MESARRFTKTRAGTPVILFRAIGTLLFGAYWGPDNQWYPCRWNADNGRYHTDPENLDKTCALDLC